MTGQDWFKKAQAENFAIGAFNVDNLEIFKAISAAGQSKKSPVMVEFSQGEVGYFGLDNIVDLVANAREFYGIPILLNLDHAKKVEDCLAALRVSSPLRQGSEGQAGSSSFDQVHFDGSDLDFEANVEAIKKIVESAHSKGILVEGELNKISGSSKVHREEVDIEGLKKSYTDPERAAKFVHETQVDIFASVFGNLHGTFPVQPDLDIALLSRIREALPRTFLSMHGGSGIPASQVKEAIRVGKIVKINVNTELRQAYKDALGEQLTEKPNEYAFYNITPEVVLAVQAVVEAKIDLFGSSNKA